VKPLIEQWNQRIVRTGDTATTRKTANTATARDTTTGSSTPPAKPYDSGKPLEFAGRAKEPFWARRENARATDGKNLLVSARRMCKPEQVWWNESAGFFLDVTMVRAFHCLPPLLVADEIPEFIIHGSIVRLSTGAFRDEVSRTYTGTVSCCATTIRGRID
jgi:hypothetical protein